MEPNQLKKIVLPTVAVAGIILLVGGILLVGEPGSAGSGPNKPGPGEPAGAVGDPSMEGMTETLPDPNSPEFKDIGQGLKVWDVKVGEGEPCRVAAKVTIHYTGWNLTGKVFDSTRSSGHPSTWPLTQLVRGWQLGIPGMKPGGIRRLYIPPELAYGPQSKGADIPPNSTLVFEIKLIAAHGGAN